MIKLTTIKSNPNNPRVIRDEKFKKLVKSIEEFPKMMALRPMVVNEDMVVLGGNMRLKALKQLGYKEISEDWVKSAKDLTEDEIKRFIIADNVGFGEHDWEVLANEWDVDQLSDWGLDIPGITDIEDVEEEIVISTELDQENNYIVLKFTKDIDWLQVQSIFGLESTYSLRANGKTWSKGVGRVVDGVDAIIKIKASANEG
jgi:ParB-like chromosome segregation protein Spo0J